MQMLVAGSVLSAVPGPGAVQFHAEFDRYRLDGEFWNSGDAVDTQSAAMGRAWIAMGIADWSLWTVSVWRVDGRNPGTMMEQA